MQDVQKSNQGAVSSYQLVFEVILLPGGHKTMNTSFKLITHIQSTAQKVATLWEKKTPEGKNKQKSGMWAPVRSLQLTWRFSSFTPARALPMDV